ncbi:hypothetical protein MRB53_009710 [Persea americana]|uniref:Uncharacterized protein n=1 Tax=Persea americana TaxID=3435 RepID=A0ACC2LQK8_PERAE|nr:hypothetical protein MRB53_009710 [Persea americana]
MAEPDLPLHAEEQQQEAEEEAEAEEEEAAEEPPLLRACDIIGNVVDRGCFPSENASISSGQFIHLNPDDGDVDCIIVSNSRNQILGHIEPSIASVLCPLLDSGYISISGHMAQIQDDIYAEFPPPPLPCLIHVDTHSDIDSIAEKNLRKSRLHLLSDQSPSITVEELAGNLDRCYRNVLANSTRTAHAHPLPLHSGIFEGEFGSDTVLLILSLVAATRLTAELPHFTDITGEEVEIPPGCCRSLMSRLKVLKYRQMQGEEADDRSKDPKKLRKFEIVLTTYSMISMENNDEESPISKIEWRRIILHDSEVDAEVIDHVDSPQRFAPFSSIENWRRRIVEGLDNELPRLQVLLRIISLQSAIKHGLVGLPGKDYGGFFRGVF